MDLAGQVVVVVGLARSGIAAARFLARHGARVVASDSKGPDGFEDPVLSLPREGVRLELGENKTTTLLGADLVVVSPGVPWDLPALRAARGAGVEVVGELEFGARFIRGPIAAVTGTKGKSTTTAALGAMLRADGRDARVGGNIGAPVTSLLDDQKDDTVFALEVSSFQLEGIRDFHPRVAVFLNLTPDHLDRHRDFAAYRAAKARIFENQGEEDFAVFNRDDAEVAPLAREGRARGVSFGQSPAEGAFFDGDEAVLVRGSVRESLFSRKALGLAGPHLAQDVLAAATAARLLGASPEAISRGVSGLRPLAHVLEDLGAVRGVRFVNDSKATNVDAARKSLEAFPPHVVPILGGRFKGGDLRLLREPARGRARAIVAIGEAQERVEEALRGAAPILRAGTLEEAVATAFRAAEPGDVVLLAPACASFDMFPDYAARGEAFRAAVAALREREG
jgi:UDP-N-acetylmuramoylalanine--D-glutamate ligase